MNIQKQLALMIAGVKDVQDKNVPLHAGSLIGLLNDCAELLDQAELALSMVDANNRITAGQYLNEHTGRPLKAWDGKFVASEVGRVLTALRSNAQAHRKTGQEPTHE